jgi:hypothetical protein
MLYLFSDATGGGDEIGDFFSSVVPMAAQPGKLRTLGESVLQWL